MAQPRTHRSPSPTVAALIVIGMLAMVGIPAAVSLHAVRSPGTLNVGVNPSPRGYTWSLLLSVVPILVIALWFLPSEGLEIPQRAFWRTIGSGQRFGRRRQRRSKLRLYDYILLEPA